MQKKMIMGDKRPQEIADGMSESVPAEMAPVKTAYVQDGIAHVENCGVHNPSPLEETHPVWEHPFPWWDTLCKQTEQKHPNSWSTANRKIVFHTTNN